MDERYTVVDVAGKGLVIFSAYGYILIVCYGPTLNCPPSDAPTPVL